MIPLGLSITSPALLRRAGYVPASASAAALFAAFTGSYADGLKEAIDTAIVTMEGDGSWADFDVLYPKGAIPGTSPANVADGYLNWKSPGAFTLVPVNSPTNGNGYWQGDGSAARLRTQYTPVTHAVKYAQNDASISLWAKTTGTSVYADAGSVAGSNTASLNVLSGTNAIAVMNGGGAITRGPSNGLELTIVQRRASDDLRIYKNGAQLGATLTTAASSGLPTIEQWVLGGNSIQFGDAVLQLAAWGASQAGREAAIYSTFQTLFTAAGTI